MNSKLNLVISTPLEAEFVDRIARVAPNRIEIHYEPELLPPTRYQGDHKGIDNFERTPADEERWFHLISAADILFDIPPTLSNKPNPVNLARNLKWVQTTSSGVGPLVDSLGLTERNVLVTTARGIHAKPLSEFVFMALLMHYRNLEYLQKQQGEKIWQRYCGSGLAGRTLAIVGMGEVGQKIAHLAKAFDMTVVGLLRPGSPHTTESLGIDRICTINELKDLLSDIDAIVLCAPHTPETEGMIGQSVFEAVKPGTVLINIARGALVDEPALIGALKSGQIGFAALDVAAVEPLPESSPLWTLENVLISPHSASTVAEENERLTDLFCFNLRHFLEGNTTEMKNKFNTERRY